MLMLGSQGDLNLARAQLVGLLEARDILEYRCLPMRGLLCFFFFFSWWVSDLVLFPSPHFRDISSMFPSHYFPHSSMVRSWAVPFAGLRVVYAFKHLWDTDTSFAPRLPSLDAFDTQVRCHQVVEDLCWAKREGMKMLQMGNILFSSQQVLCFPALLKKKMTIYWHLRSHRHYCASTTKYAWYKFSLINVVNAK